MKILLGTLWPPFRKYTCMCCGCTRDESPRVENQAGHPWWQATDSRFLEEGRKALLAWFGLFGLVVCNHSLMLVHRLSQEQPQCRVLGPLGFPEPGAPIRSSGLALKPQQDQHPGHGEPHPGLHCQQGDKVSSSSFQALLYCALRTN